MIKRVCEFLSIFLFLIFLPSISFAEFESNRYEIENFVELVGHYDSLVYNDITMIENIFTNKYEYYFQNDKKEDENIENYHQGYKAGIDAGITKGGVYATEDFYFQNPNNWRFHYPEYLDLIFDYNLLLEDENYRIGFLDGYLEGFSKGYRDMYYKLHYDSISSETKLEIVPISGGEVKSYDGSFTIKIQQGTYLSPVIITLKTISDNYVPNIKLDKASNIYNINILSKSWNKDNNKKIEIRFEYYGKYNGGIYKLVDNKWIYIPSTVENGYIRAELKPSLLTDYNIFCVFVDEEYIPLYDVRNHWAKDEIIAFQRNGIISGYPNRTFKPDKQITLGEFFSILMKINSVNQYIVREYSDNYNDKNQKVSYRDLEIIMKKVLNMDNFNWKDVSIKLLYEKQHKDRSSDSMDNYVTRAEVIYMLYLLEGWKQGDLWS